MKGILGTAEELADLGGWTLDLRTRVSRWSDALCRIHGLPPGCRPSISEILECIHEDDRPRIAALLAAILESPDTVPAEGIGGEYCAQLPDGTLRDIRFLGRVERDQAGNSVRWSGAAQNISLQRVAERELRVHHALSQTLREWESFDEGVVTLLERLATALEYPLASLWTWNATIGRLSCRAFWTAQDTDGAAFEDITRSLTLRAGEGLPGRAWEAQEPVALRSIAGTPWMTRKRLAAEIGVRSALALPAVASGETLAVVSLYGFDEREPSARIAQVLAGTAQELGAFLSRHRGHLDAAPLSQREIEILQLAAEGLSGPAIADRLVVSPSTVKSHFENIYEKLGVSDRAAAVAQGIRIGLIR